MILTCWRDLSMRWCRVPYSLQWEDYRQDWRKSNIRRNLKIRAVQQCDPEFGNFFSISLGAWLKHPSALFSFVHPHKMQLHYSVPLHEPLPNFLYNILDKNVSSQIKTLYFFICANNSFYVTWSKRSYLLTWLMSNWHINF